MEVVENLEAWAERQRGAIVALARNWAGQLEGRVKRDAPWMDRTGNARAGLYGSIEVRPDEILIRVGHSMEYGVFLELARDGRYAILKPTIDAAVPEVSRSLKRLWE
ncbi:MAG: hypothetical protein DDT37_01899 [Firmicutes bacterium]|nr:hypothetical protein [candidate division NPL-UPA2 bacterium]